MCSTISPSHCTIQRTSSGNLLTAETAVHTSQPSFQVCSFIPPHYCCYGSDTGKQHNAGGAIRASFTPHSTPTPHFYPTCAIRKQVVPGLHAVPSRCPYNRQLQVLHQQFWFLNLLLLLSISKPSSPICAPHSSSPTSRAASIPLLTALLHPTCSSSSVGYYTITCNTALILRVPKAFRANMNKLGWVFYLLSTLH